MFIPVFVMAGTYFSLGFGSINQLQSNLVNPEPNLATVVDVTNWATGAELRAKVLGLQIDGYLLFQQGEIVDVTEQGRPLFADGISQRLFGMLGVGCSTEVATATTLSLMAGSLLGLNVSQNYNAIFWAGSEDNVCTRGNWGEFLSQIPLAYRMRFDINLSRFSFGIHYQVPSQGFSYAQNSWAALEPDWQQGRIGASFITTIF